MALSISACCHARGAFVDVLHASSDSGHLVDSHLGGQKWGISVMGAPPCEGWSPFAELRSARCAEEVCLRNLVTCFSFCGFGHKWTAQGLEVPGKVMSSLEIVPGGAAVRGPSEKRRCDRI